VNIAVGPANTDIDFAGFMVEWQLRYRFTDEMGAMVLPGMGLMLLHGDEDGAVFIARAGIAWFDFGDVDGGAAFGMFSPYVGIGLYVDVINDTGFVFDAMIEHSLRFTAHPHEPIAAFHIGYAFLQL